MSVPTWQPGTLYQPNALVVPLTAPAVVSGALLNGNFEAGDTDWTKGTGWVINNTSGAFDGSYSGSYPSATGANLITNDKEVPVTPGQSISAQVMVNTTGNSVSQGGAAVRIVWRDASHADIAAVEGNIVRGGGDHWFASGVTAVAPPGAAFAKFAVNAFRNSGPHNILIDAATWDYAFAPPPDGLIFRAVQADAAYSANTEPAWPTVLGTTVIDGGVTWEAVQTTRVVWEASPILVSGATEPTFSPQIGGTVADNTIGWRAISRRITDSKCPNTPPVAIAASKIFAGDGDIIPFCATINPLDWTTRDDAGYLPFGLQTYGSQSVTALGLYRGNLVAFNSLGFQMWQVDQDPANMALLDSVPVSCTFPKTVQPLANDLMFLNAKGVRNISIAGASTNLQANGVGEPIDALVRQKIIENVYEPIGLYWPFTGQYWLVFGKEVFVLTINGAAKKSWSRYTFPGVITDWTIDGNDLCLSALLDDGTHVIWRMDEDSTLDDTQDAVSVFTLGPLPPEAIHIANNLQYVSLPPAANMTPYTVCGWVRFVGDGFGTNPLRVPFAESQSSGVTAVYPFQNGGFYDMADPNTSGPYVESPENDRWFFFGIVNVGGGSPGGTGYWCYLEDSSFTADRTLAAIGLGSPATGIPDFATVGGFRDFTGVSAPILGDICQVRRWSAALTPTELLAEKDSPTFVRSANLFSSNPMRGAADMTDESGNGNTGTAHGPITDVSDGPGN